MKGKKANIKSIKRPKVKKLNEEKMHDIHSSLMARMFGICKQVEGGWLIPNDVAKEISDGMATRYKDLPDRAKNYYKTLIEE